MSPIPEQDLSTARLVAFLSAIAVAALVGRLSRPDGATMRAASMAALWQLWLGVVLDAACAWLGFWTWIRPEPAAAGVPIDIHLTWSLIWGWTFCALDGRLAARGIALAGYVSAWILLAVVVDRLSLPLLSNMVTVAPRADAANSVMLAALLSSTLWLFRSVRRNQVRAPDDRARQEALLRSIAYVPLFVSIAYVFFPWVILRQEQRGSLAPDLSLVWLAIPAIVPLLVGIWAVFEFARVGLGTPVPLDPTRRLVFSGPYAFVANPMQISGVAGAGVVLVLYPSLFVALYFMDVFLLAEFVFRPLEERALERRFGEAWTRYRQVVRRWLPRWKPYVPPAGPRLTLYFDDQCRICGRSVLWVKRWWSRGNIEYKPLGEAKEIAPRWDPEAMLVREERSSGERWYRGADGALRLMGDGPLHYATLAALGWLPVFHPFVHLGYWLVARSRYKL